jgi:predicted Rossmann fold nucleotide-binding protein DprA/Smf involved in DNA uptake
LVNVIISKAERSRIPIVTLGQPPFYSKHDGMVAGVGFEPTEVDLVAGRTGIGMQELLPALALLELKGYVTRDAGGAFMRSPTGRGSR